MAEMACSNQCAFATRPAEGGKSSTHPRRSRIPWNLCRGFRRLRKLSVVLTEAPAHYEEETLPAFSRFKAALNPGKSCSPTGPSTKTGWRANPWVKKGFSSDFAWALSRYVIDPVKQPFFDSLPIPARVHGGGRRPHRFRVAPAFAMAVTLAASHLHAAHVCECWRLCGRRHMIDSSCPRWKLRAIGSNCHSFRRAQIGGVLKPSGALPVIH